MRIIFAVLLLTSFCFAEKPEYNLKVKVIEAGVSSRSTVGDESTRCDSLSHTVDCATRTERGTVYSFAAWVSAGDGREYQIACSPVGGNCRTLRAGDTLPGYWDKHGYLILIGHRKPDGSGKEVKGRYAVIGSRIQQSKN